MKVNKLSEPWTKFLGVTVTLEASGDPIVVQVPKQDNPLLTIVHESVHVWQKIMEYMGEDNPGIETEAYTIEYIVKELGLLYQKQTGDTLALHDKRKTRL